MKLPWWTCCARVASGEPRLMCSPWSRYRADHPLLSLDNVVLTPHEGYVSEGGFEQFAQDVTANINAYLDGREVPNMLNRRRFRGGAEPASRQRCIPTGRHTRVSSRPLAGAYWTLHGVRGLNGRLCPRGTAARYDGRA